MLLYGGGSARAHQQLQSVADIVRHNMIDGEMLASEYASADAIVAMLSEECATSGGRLDGPRLARVTKLFRELLTDPEKERQHRSDVRRLVSSPSGCSLSERRDAVSRQEVHSFRACGV